MMRILVLIVFFINLALASEITTAFNHQDFKSVTKIYQDNPGRSFNAEELAMISHALRETGFYRPDINLNIRLLTMNHNSRHEKLMKDISRGETIDGEDYPEAQKVLYWNLLNDYGAIIKGYNNQSELFKPDHQEYLKFSKILGELEFREGEVDKVNDRIMSHITYLSNRVYKFKKSLSALYISWQSESTLRGANSETGLVVTNRGMCLGGEAGWENSLYHFYLDGCFLIGSGGVSSDASSPITYRQSNVAAYGTKFGPGASMIVSSSGSRIGIKVPVIYSVQKLQEPQSHSFNISENSPLSFVTSLYSRWQFNKWYFQTEFGKYIQQEQTYWGIGLGKNF